MVMSCTCGGRSVDKNLLWLVKLLWRLEPYYAYLSMYDYVMRFVVVPC
jgi:hypothetical protein